MNVFVLTLYLMSGETLEMPFIGTSAQAVVQAESDYATMPCIAVDVISNNRLVYFIGEEP